MHHLLHQPVCQDCLPRVTPAVLVHHADKDTSNNSEDNLVSLCNDCHEKRHKATRYGRGH
jgi:5-methylcytosine-specific restriction endonuclease McrA